MRLAIQLKATVPDAAIVVIRDVRNWLGCLLHARIIALEQGSRPRRLGSPAWLAAGFIAHVGWDLMHHNGINHIDTQAVPGWYASACMAYDLPVGIAALILS